MRSQESIALHAAELHERAIVIDCHSDILMPIADGYVRLGKHVDIPDPEKWEPPFEMAESSSTNMGWPLSNHFGCIGQYSIPQFLAGGMTAQVCAIFVEDHQLENALRRSLEMIWWMHREVEENDDFDLVTTVSDIHQLKREGKCGGILAL